MNVVKNFNNLTNALFFTDKIKKSIDENAFCVPENRMNFISGNKVKERTYHVVFQYDNEKGLNYGMQLLFGDNSKFEESQ